MAQAPLGQRYSHVYMERGVPQHDSARFRSRLAHYVDGPLAEHSSVLAKALELELGATISSTNYGYCVGDFLLECPLPDLLDALTLVFRSLEMSTTPRRHGHPHVRWCEFVARCMAEENVGYRIDDQGGVHQLVDQEFDRNQAAAVAALQHPDLANALHAHEAAYRHFESQHQDRKAAVRSIFETVEILAKLLCPETQRLNVRLLRPVCLPLMAQDPTEQLVMGSVFDSLEDWATGLHNYRHGQREVEPVEPSEQLTVWALSAGSGFARILAECYSARTQA